MNVAFGSAARKVSRHQLYKHVSAHVYLGVLAYYAKQRPSRCGSHMIMSMNRLRGTLSYSQIWEVQIGSCESRYHVMQPLEAHIHVYTYFVYGEKWPFGWWWQRHGPGRHLHVRCIKSMTAMSMTRMYSSFVTAALCLYCCTACC